MKLAFVVLFYWVFGAPAIAAKISPIANMTSPAAQAVLVAAQALGSNQVFAYKLKYYFPESPHSPGDIDDIYFYNDRVKETMSENFPRYGEAKGYNIGIGTPARFQNTRRSLSSSPFLLAHEPLLDAMIAGVENGLAAFWLGRTLVPRGIYAYGVIDYANQEFLYIVNFERP